MLQSIWAKIKLYPFMSSIEDDDILDYAQYACQRCIDWFGPPDDSEWPISIMEGPYTACQRNYLLRRYILTLNHEWYQSRHRFAAIGHEMFHRVTYRRKGLLSQLWASEMIAECASQQLLCERGRSSDAGALAKYYRSQPQMKDRGGFYNARPRRTHFGFGGWTYSENFHATAFCLGSGLESIVTWESLRHLPEYASVQDWIASLSKIQQQLVWRIMQLNKNVVETDVANGLFTPYAIEPRILSVGAKQELAYALFSQGRFPEAILECQNAIAMKPTSYTSYIYMGYALEESGQIRDAINAYENALRLGSQDTEIQLRIDRLLNMIDR